MTTQLSIFGEPQLLEDIEQLPGTVAQADLPGGYYLCPCCSTTVADDYVEGDALCAWCRDLDDPRLSDRVRDARQRAPGLRRCCLARSRGESRTLVGWRCDRYDSRVTNAELAPAMRGQP